MHWSFESRYTSEDYNLTPVIDQHTTSDSRRRSSISPEPPSSTRTSVTVVSRRPLMVRRNHHVQDAGAQPDDDRELVSNHANEPLLFSDSSGSVIAPLCGDWVRQ